MTYPPQPPQQQQVPEQPQPQYGQYPQQQFAPQSNSLATLGFILALVAIPLIFVPILNFIAFFLPPAALILSIIANNQIKNSGGRMTGKGLAVAGIWISAIWMVVGLIMLVFAGIFAASFLGELQNLPINP